MLQEFPLDKIIEPLLDWFESHARTLPWREDPSPYRVWVSEIMLQQTRVEAVKPYFERFLKALPDVKSLAECEEETLLKLWEGLGYYNRVRNMQAAARTILEEYGGQIPADYEALLKLKGIGHYTAGAIASIAYQIPVPAVDGNVLRVISRVSGDSSDIMKQSVRTAMEEALRNYMPRERPGAFNQALMELGATVCVPNGAPFCQECPWETFCCAHIDQSWDRIPVKSKAKPRKVEKRTVFVIRAGEQVALNKRPDKGLLAGLYEFPNQEGHLTEDEALEWVKSCGISPIRIQPLAKAKHIFSHVEWQMIGYAVRVDELSHPVDGRPEQADEFLFVEIRDTEERYPIPAAFSAYTGYMHIRLGNERFSEPGNLPLSDSEHLPLSDSRYRLRPEEGMPSSGVEDSGKEK